MQGVQDNGEEVGGEKASERPHVLLFWERQQPIWREGEPEAAAVREEEEHQPAVGGA